MTPNLWHLTFDLYSSRLPEIPVEEGLERGRSSIDGQGYERK